jgi:hypothetical protein
MRFAASVDCFQIIFLMIRLIFVFVLANRLQATWTRTQFSNAARRSRGAVLHQVDMLFPYGFFSLPITIDRFTYLGCTSHMFYQI